MASTVLMVVGVAWSASGTITATLRPDTTRHASTFHLVAQGPFSSQNQLPRSVATLITLGFRIDPRAVSPKCSPGSSGSPCPSGSQIGAGQADVQVSTSVGFGSGTYNIPFRLYLGPPAQAGDIASVILQGSFSGRSFSTTGRLFRISQAPYGLELETQVPQQQPPPGVTFTATLQRLTLTVGATRKVHTKRRRTHHRRVYSLITNPPRCSQGSWPAEVIITAADGSSQSFKFAASCREG